MPERTENTENAENEVVPDFGVPNLTAEDNFDLGILPGIIVGQFFHFVGAHAIAFGTGNLVSRESRRIALTTLLAFQGSY